MGLAVQRSANDVTQQLQFNPLMPGGNKKVTHT